MKWLYVVAGSVALLVGVTVTAFAVAGTVWTRSSRAVVGAMARGVAAQPPHWVPSAPVGDPVDRYLARSVPLGQETPILVVFEQEGTFQMGEGDAGWRPFTARQTVRLYPPAFLWDARIEVAPLMDARVRDRYLDGKGGMTAKIGGLVTVVDAPPTRELARAALVRYLAEAPWVPARLRPVEGLTWTVVDDTTAVATLADGGHEASATFTIDAGGDVTRVFVPDRGREVDGAYVPTPWVGRFWDHAPASEGGPRIPFQGEVAWIVDGDTVPYWRGRMSSVRTIPQDLGQASWPEPGTEIASPPPPSEGL